MIICRSHKVWHDWNILKNVYFYQYVPVLNCISLYLWPMFISLRYLLIIIITFHRHYFSLSFFHDDTLRNLFISTRISWDSVLKSYSNVEDVLLFLFDWRICHFVIWWNSSSLMLGNGNWVEEVVRHCHLHTWWDVLSPWKVHYIELSLCLSFLRVSKS